MTSQPVQTAGKRILYLPLIPPELVIMIYCQLRSFSDIFALAGTCRPLRDIWFSNITAISAHVAPRCIACEPQARLFLIDKGGPALNSPLSVKDLVHMVRNSHVVEEAIRQFEREIVCRVKMDGYSASQYYGAGAHRHPPTLTCTERLRFVRSYYTLWGLMKTDDSSKRLSRLKSMTLKQLYRLYEMTKLTQSIGQGEESIAPPIFLDQPPDSVHSINTDRSEKRIALSGEVWEQIQKISQRFFHQDAQDPIAYAKHEGFMWFVVLWDHWQESLKDLVCRQSTTSPEFKPSPATERQYLWDDSSDNGQSD